MSILVALRGSEGVVVATDSRRHEADGTFSDGYDKTFRLGRGVIGGAIGLLEVKETGIANILQSQLTINTAATLEELVRDASTTLLNRLNASNHYQPVEVVFAGSVVLDGAAVSPFRFFRLERNANGVYAGEPRVLDDFACIAGDDAAHAAILAALKGRKNQVRGMRRFALIEYAKHLIALGIRKAGPHPAFPEGCSCGAPPRYSYESIGKQKATAPKRP